MTDVGLAAVGLDRLEEELKKLVGEIKVELHPCVIGPVAGRFVDRKNRGEPNSAAKLTCEAGEVWIPGPIPDGLPSPGQAPLYRVRGRLMVMPFIRLRVVPGEVEVSRAGGRSNDRRRVVREVVTEYLTL